MKSMPKQYGSKIIPYTEKVRKTKLDKYTEKYIFDINNGKYDDAIKNQKLFNLNPEIEKIIQKRRLKI